MTGPLPALIAAAVALFFLDRLLLLLEGWGWIYYRKTKARRGAIGYHMLEMSSVFDPSHRVVQEIQVREERQEDASGEQLGTSPQLHSTEEGA